MATTTLRPDAASGGLTDRSGQASGAVVDVDKYKYKYLVAIAVSLAAMLELIDTSIVNVAIPPDDPHIWEQGRWEGRERPVDHWGLGAMNYRPRAVPGTTRRSSTRPGSSFAA